MLQLVTKAMIDWRYAGLWTKLIDPALARRVYVTMY